MVVGAHAVFVHGLPRFSLDLDMAIAWPAEDRETVRTRIEAAGLKDVEWVRDEWGQRYRCLDPSGLPIELFFSADTEVQRREFERRVERDIDGVAVPFISPEDLVLRKLVNTRMRRGADFDDAVGVLRMQADAFDAAYVRRGCAVYRVCDLFEDALARAHEPD